MLQSGPHKGAESGIICFCSASCTASECVEEASSVASDLLSMRIHLGSSAAGPLVCLLLLSTLVVIFVSYTHLWSSPRCYLHQKAMLVSSWGSSMPSSVGPGIRALPAGFVKTVHFVRHGQAWSNVYGEVDHDQYNNEAWFDASLSVKGWQQ
jgi:hypothetical protein